MDTTGYLESFQKKHKFSCEICNFNTSNKSNYDKHLTTLKHINGYNIKTFSKKNTEVFNNKYKCYCGKNYTYSQGLSKHKRKCVVYKEKEEDNKLDKDADMIWTLVKQNQEFKDMMMEQQKFMLEMAQKSNSTIQNITNNHNHIVQHTQNTQNNQFNLQFFLNETCKDAMNINQFIDSIQIQLEDLDYTGKHGYIKGISNVLVRELKALDQKVRPIHCSDEKREVLYIKTNNVWEKDTDYAGVTRITKHLAHKKFLKIKEWVEENPTCMAHDDKKNDEYLSILGQITSGFTHLNGSECQDSIKKIIKAIVKQVTIQKNVIK